MPAVRARFASSALRLLVASVLCAEAFSAPVATSATEPTPQNVFFAVGGSPIHPAGSVLFSEPNISFGLTEVTPPNPQFVLLQARDAPSSPWDNAANVWFGAPTGMQLEVGTYLNAHRFAAVDVPMLSVSVDSGCNRTAGQFVVEEITRDAGGHLMSFAANFEQYCEEYVAPQNTIVGLVRYNSALGWSAWTLTPRSLTFPPLAVGVTAAQTLTLQASGTYPLDVSASVDGPAAADFAVADPNDCLGVLAPGSSCDFSVQFTPSATGYRSATLHLAPAAFAVADQIPLSGGGRLVTETSITSITSAAYPRSAGVVFQVLPNGPGTIQIESTGTLYGTGSVHVDGSGSAVAVFPPGIHQVLAHFLTNDTYFESYSMPVQVTTLVQSITQLLISPEVSYKTGSMMFGEQAHFYAWVECQGSYPLTGGTLSIRDTDTGETLATGELGTGRFDLRLDRRIFGGGSLDFSGTVASHRYEAVYSGHGMCAPSSDNAVMNVSKIETGMSLSAPNVYYPSPTTLTAYVSPVPDSGVVTFYSGDTAIASTPISAATGRAQVVLNLSPGTRSLWAGYSGSAGFRHAGTGSVSHRVSVRTAISLVAEPDSVNEGVPTVVTGTLSAIGAGAPSAGQLTMTDESTGAFLGSVQVGPSALVISQTLLLTQGHHVIKVNYGGSGDYDPSFADIAIDVGPRSSDSIPPAGAISINGGATFTDNPAVTLTLSATDPIPGTGVTAMQLSQTQGSWPASWQAYGTSIGITLAGGDGPKQVYARFRDGAGNISVIASAGIVVDTSAPSPPGVEQSIVQGSTIGSSVPVLVSFAAADATSGVAAYRLSQSKDGGKTYTDVQIPAANSSASRSLVPGSRSYRFRARATDMAGNQTDWTTGEAFSVLVLQDAAGVYSGGWAKKSNSKASGGKFREAAKAGSSVRFSFSGKDVGVVARVGPNCGQAAVYVDGVFLGNLDLYSRTAGWRNVVMAASFLDNGPHSLEVRVLGTRNRLSAGAKVQVDGLVVLK